MGSISRSERPPSAAFRIIRAILVLSVAAGIALLLLRLKKEPEKKDIARIPPVVRVIRAEPVSRSMTVDAHGTVRPAETVRVAVEVPGRILALHPDFAAGGMVRRGETLVQIDPAVYDVDRQRAEVRVRQARVDIRYLRQDLDNLTRDAALYQTAADLAQREFQRIRALNENRFASANTLDKAEQQYLQAKMQHQTLTNRLALADTLMEQKQAVLALAEADLATASLALEKTRIIAGFDAFVLERRAEPGEYVQPGQVLGALYEKGRLEVDVAVPVEHLTWIRPAFEQGRTPSARIASTHEGADISLEGRVVRIHAAMDEKTRTLPMTLAVHPSSDTGKGVMDIRPGFFVKCTISGVRADGIVVLPRHLLRPDGTVFTVAGQRLNIRPVTVLRTLGDEVYISEGLADGDLIVSSPLPNAVDGMALTLEAENH